MTDERQKATKVKCKRDESVTKRLRLKIFRITDCLIAWLSELKSLMAWNAVRCLPQFLLTLGKSEIQLSSGIIIMTTGFIMKTLIYVISMEFLSWSRRRSSARNVPSSEERGETDVFAGYSFLGPPLSKMAAESNFPPWDVQDIKFPTHMRFTGCNSRGL